MKPSEVDHNRRKKCAEDKIVVQIVEGFIALVLVGLLVVVAVVGLDANP